MQSYRVIAMMNTTDATVAVVTVIIVTYTMCPHSPCNVPGKTFTSRHLKGVDASLIS